ncbi:kinesin-like protein KIF12 isoform X2 [Oppia nitens]|uniref:kinesin-like protein KIF12 isoform X2 n=1 Tax=Oppia nitens TaxID=1686743 RepID=UPI0023DAA2A1|nr:kinesin-like protein KIF12 isoform X2 [Oppia nitens]
MTSTTNSRSIDSNEQMTGRGVSNNAVFHDQRPPELGFDNINVTIRVRPVSTKYGLYSDRKESSLNFPDAGQIQVCDPISGTSRSFTFNVVFEPEATQEEVFEHSGVKRLIDMSLDGFACTVLAYGQTSSGKTYTLTGNAFEQISTSESTITGKGSPNDGRGEGQGDRGEKKMIGVMQLAFAYLFEQIKLRKNRSLFYIIHVSYLEVYNEQVLDLLNPSPKSLNVRWAKDRGFYAENLFKVECEDIGDLEGVLEEGCKNRQVRSHSMNDNSSRSHSVMTITLASETQDPEDPQGYIRREGRLCIVDLAGSEKTKRTNSKGETLIEANNINRSLLVLGNCISSLADPKRRSGHIPYRDSTLTKLLADSLSGSGMTLMLDASETINTLRYAARAKKVKTHPIVQMDPRELLILSLKREVRLLRMENNYLRQQLNLGNGYLVSTSNGLAGNKTSTERPTSNESNGSMDEKIQLNGEAGLQPEILNKYMQENESLRAENSQLHQQRQTLIHDHELVCRENERLLRRLSAAGDNADSTARLTIEDECVDSNHLSSDLKSNAMKDLKGSRRQALDNERQTKAIQQNQLLVQHNGSVDLSPNFELRGTSAAAARTRIIRKSNK